MAPHNYTLFSAGWGHWWGCHPAYSSLKGFVGLAWCKSEPFWPWACTGPLPEQHTGAVECRQCSAGAPGSGGAVAVPHEQRFLFFSQVGARNRSLETTTKQIPLVLSLQN